MITKPPKAILLSDSRFGHQRIVLGIAKSLAASQNIEFSWLKIDEVGKPHRSWQRLKAICGLPLQNLSYVISSDPDPLPAFPTLRSVDGATFDFVIGAGPRCAAPAIAIARACHARSIYFGNPSIPFLKEFDLMIRFAPIWWSRTPTISHFRPNDIIPEPSNPELAQRRKTASFLIGGNKHWNNETARDFCDIIRMMTEDYDVTIFNSRRTPDLISDKISEFLADTIKRINHQSATNFIDCRLAGFNSNLNAYKSDLIIVTADSMSMIAEAVSAQRKVIALVPNHYDIPRDDIEEIEYFQKRRHIALLSPRNLRDGVKDLSEIISMKDNHIENLSKKLKAALSL